MGAYVTSPSSVENFKVILLRGDYLRVVHQLAVGFLIVNILKERFYMQLYEIKFNLLHFFRKINHVPVIIIFN